MQYSNLSLKSLELFQMVAKSGSVQKVAQDTGLSISTVSHHLRRLEDNLNVSLLDHARRPMVLTPAGVNFLRYVEGALRLIRKGEVQLKSGNLAEARELRLGIVDDFDSEIAPELAQLLAGAMPKCTFRHHTRPSHEIIQLLMENRLDVGVATRPVNDVPGLVEYPLLRDPFVLVVPANHGAAPEDFLAGQTSLPFLRYARDQIIGGRIEAHLRRLRISLPNRFELESNQSLIGMVAEGSGWAITTPAGYLRAKRFHRQVRLHPYPGKGFTRMLSLYTTELYVLPVAEMILTTLRRLIDVHFMKFAHAEMPWLADSFYLMPDIDAR
ncbi:MAG TPA: LysR family transcriptional regulator [Rhodobacteraceae bacterium]|nr:LysR family transcriptional regulator [Paracoccaceae bacterium]